MNTIDGVRHIDLRGVFVDKTEVGGSTYEWTCSDQAMTQHY